MGGEKKELLFPRKILIRDTSQDLQWNIELGDCGNVKFANEKQTISDKVNWNLYQQSYELYQQSGDLRNFRC